MATTTAIGVTPAEYLEFERQSSLKHEYRDGEMIEVTGASRQHNRIEINLARIISSALTEGDAEVFGSSMRVKIDESGRYVYPDTSIAVDPPIFEDSEVDTLLNPAIIFEVLSKSTESYDRGEKFADYRSVPSVTDYFLISQKEPLVERFTRDDGDEWPHRVYSGFEASIDVPHISCRLNLRDLYLKVDLSQFDA